eukprot:10096991-Lingulodinium_polyedra.AAC.1
MAAHPLARCAAGLGDVPPPPLVGDKRLATGTPTRCAVLARADMCPVGAVLYSLACHQCYTPHCC